MQKLQHKSTFFFCQGSKEKQSLTNELEKPRTDGGFIYYRLRTGLETVFFSSLLSSRLSIFFLAFFVLH